MATLAENAAAVKLAQVAIDAAIVAKGGTTEGGLNNAAAAIAALPSGGGEVVPLSVTENGTYTPPSGVDGYAPVTVNVPDRLAARADATCAGAVYSNTITALADYAFYKCSNLTSIDLPNCETVGSYALSNCECITSLNLPKLKTVTTSSFSGLRRCQPLSDVSHVTTISGSQVFALSGGNATMPPEPRVANFAALTSVSGATYIFNGSKWWTVVKWPLITSIATGAFSSTQGSFVKELYLDSMTYDAAAKPTGFPWGIAANTYYWDFKIHFSNCTIQQIQGTGWVIVEE